MKSFLKQLGVLLLVGAGMFGVWRWLESGVQRPTVAAAAAAAPMRVAVFELVEKELDDQIVALGTVAAAESADLSAKVTEVVEELLFEDGQTVKKGDVLVRLSAGEIAASLAAAEANLAEQEREQERLRDLVSKGAAPSARLDERVTQVELAKRRIDEEKAKLDDRVIVAPFDGRLGLRRISPGALVSPGTVLVTLDQLDEVRVDFPVPETLLRDLRVGMQVKAGSVAWPGREFLGEVAQIDSRVDPITRSVMVRAVMKNEDLALRAGMLMQVMASRPPRAVMMVPERALLGVGRRSFVFLVEQQDGQTVAKQVEVQIGKREPGFVEVSGELVLGQKIISDGVMGLRSGAAVEVVETFKEPAAAYNPRVGAGGR